MAHGTDGRACATIRSVCHMILFLDAIAGVIASGEPDERLPIALFLSPSNLRVPVFFWHMVQGIGKVRLYIVLQSEDYGICLTLVKPLIDVILKYHGLRSLSLCIFCNSACRSLYQ